MSDSILNSVKKILGITEDYKYFDSDIIMHLNTVMMTLNQMGIGPPTPLHIEDETTTWDQFCGDKVDIDAVRTYTALKVRLIFDPPQSSSHLDAIRETLKECEWRMYVADSSHNFDVKEPQIKWE